TDRRATRVDLRQLLRSRGSISIRHRYIEARKAQPSTRDRWGDVARQLAALRTNGQLPTPAVIWARPPTPAVARGRSRPRRASARAVSRSWARHPDGRQATLFLRRRPARV